MNKIKFNSCFYSHIAHYSSNILTAHILYLGFIKNVYPIIKAFMISRLIYYLVVDLVEKGHESINIITFTTNNGDTSKLSHFYYQIDLELFKYLKFIFFILLVKNYYKYQENNGLNNYVFSILVHTDEFEDELMKNN